MGGVDIRIPVVPVAKGRPRYSTYRGYVHFFTPDKTKNYEDLIASHYHMANGPLFEKGTPIRLSLRFGLPIPQSTPKYKKQLMIDGGIFHTKKPDLDNLIKAVLDGLNKVAWEDDSQIVQIFATKEYTLEPYVFIGLREWEWEV